MLELIVIPLLVTISALVVEYWIVQPIRSARQKDEVPHVSLYISRHPFIDHMRRLYMQFFSPNTYRFSAIFIRGIGNFISSFPAWIISSLLSFLALLMSIPFYLALYGTEKATVCKYHPSCKEYLVLAIEAYGPIRGLALGINRVGRCSHLTPGGSDPISQTLNNEDLINILITKHNLIATLYGLVIIVSVLFVLTVFSVAAAPVVMNYFGISNFVFGILISIITSLFLFSFYMLVLAAWAHLIKSKIYGKRAAVVSVVLLVVYFIVYLILKYR